MYYWLWWRGESPAWHIGWVIVLVWSPSCSSVYSHLRVTNCPTGVVDPTRNVSIIQSEETIIRHSPWNTNTKEGAPHLQTERISSKTIPPYDRETQLLSCWWYFTVDRTERRVIKAGWKVIKFLVSDSYLIFFNLHTVIKQLQPHIALVHTHTQL